jgi:hypothetical protein
MAGLALMPCYSWTGMIGSTVPSGSLAAMTASDIGAALLQSVATITVACSPASSAGGRPFLVRPT